MLDLRRASSKEISELIAREQLKLDTCDKGDRWELSERINGLTRLLDYAITREILNSRQSSCS